MCERVTSVMGSRRESQGEGGVFKWWGSSIVVRMRYTHQADPPRPPDRGEHTARRWEERERHAPSSRLEASSRCGGAPADAGGGGERGGGRSQSTWSGRGTTPPEATPPLESFRGTPPASTSFGDITPLTFRCAALSTWAGVGAGAGAPPSPPQESPDWSTGAVSPPPVPSA